MGKGGKVDKFASNKGGVYPFPSFCGSHKSMVDEAETERLRHPDLVVCKDADGMYVTDKSALDNGLADQWRCCDPKFREARLKKLAGQVFDIVVHP